MRTEQEIRERIEQLKDAKEDFREFYEDQYIIEALEWVLNDKE
jgi:hypothetical protein